MKTYTYSADKNYLPIVLAPYVQVATSCYKSATDNTLLAEIQNKASTHFLSKEVLHIHLTIWTKLTSGSH